MTKEGAETVVILPQGATDHDVADDGTGGATFLGTRVLDRPFLMVWGGYGSVDAGAEVTFTLGGRSYDLAGYARDLAELDLEDGTIMTVLPSVEPGSGLTTTSVGGSLVAVAENWEAGATVLADARVETAGPGGTRWVAPTDVAQVVLPDGRLVTALAVPAVDGTTVTGVGMADGDQIERWEPPVVAAGVEWRQVVGAAAPYVGGEPVPRVDDGSREAFRHYRAEEGSARGYVVLPGTGVGATFAPLVLDDQGLRVSPEIVHQVDKVDVEGGQDTVLTVVGGLETDGLSSIVAVAVQLAEAEGSANSWQVVGADAGAHMLIDPGAVVTVAPGQGVWLLHPTGSVGPKELHAGRIGQDVLLLPADGAEGPTMVAVHPEDAPPPRIGTAAGKQEPTQTHEFDDHGLTVRVWTVEEPTG